MWSQPWTRELCRFEEFPLPSHSSKAATMRLCCIDGEKTRLRSNFKFIDWCPCWGILFVLIFIPSGQTDLFGTILPRKVHFSSGVDIRKIPIWPQEETLQQLTLIMLESVYCIFITKFDPIFSMALWKRSPIFFLKFPLHPEKKTIDVHIIGIEKKNIYEHGNFCTHK